mmetsp:Transcript_128659/g.274584  ORF Transcript_128659/g.274584 Transcript_128659/m.274584 type:complete len:223 (+) Transcript_128659:300-968(+)
MHRPHSGSFQPAMDWTSLRQSLDHAADQHHALRSVTSIDHISRSIFAVRLMPRQQTRGQELIPEVLGEVEEVRTMVGPLNGSRGEARATEIGGHDANRLGDKVPLWVLVAEEALHLFNLQQPVVGGVADKAQELQNDRDIELLAIAAVEGVMREALNAQLILDDSQLAPRDGQEVHVAYAEAGLLLDAASGPCGIALHGIVLPGIDANEVVHGCGTVQEQHR